MEIEIILFYFFDVPIGGNWVSTTVLYAADYLTWKKCSPSGNRCDKPDDEKICQKSGGVCQPYIDAYYIETIFCTIVGLVWILSRYGTLMRLQNLPMSAWQVRSTRRKTKLLDDNDDPSLDGIA